MIEYRAMLDTNIISDLVRRPRGPVYRQVEAVGPSNICISALTSAELRYGVQKKGSERLEREIEKLLTTLDVVDFGPPADIAYGRIRDLLTREGSPIGPIDFLIAAHALSLNVTLITANVREFSRVPGLVIENWLD